MLGQRSLQNISANATNLLREKEQDSGIQAGNSKGMANTQYSEQDSTSQEVYALNVDDGQQDGKECSDLGGESVSEAWSVVENPHKFDRSKTHYPVFFLTKPTDETSASTRTC